MAAGPAARLHIVSRRVPAAAAAVAACAIGLRLALIVHGTATARCNCRWCSRPDARRPSPSRRPARASQVRVTGAGCLSRGLHGSALDRSLSERTRRRGNRGTPGRGNPGLSSRQHRRAGAFGLLGAASSAAALPGRGEGWLSGIRRRMAVHRVARPGHDAMIWPRGRRIDLGQPPPARRLRSPPESWSPPCAGPDPVRRLYSRCRLPGNPPTRQPGYRASSTARSRTANR